MPSNEGKQGEMKLALRAVIQALQDGQQGLVEIGERIKNDTLKRYFLAESLHRARFRADLENELHRQGVHDVRESGTALGKLRRTWAEVRSTFGGGELALLETAEQGEDATKEVYADALREDLPLPVHQMLSNQQEHILLVHDYVRQNRDILRMKKAS